MSAIAGIIYPELYPVTYAVKPALDALQARSLEPAETYLHKNIEIGGRGRIAFTPRRTIAAILDGTLENKEKLIQELGKAGCPLTQTEPALLVAHAYDVWGEGCLAYLHGAFAICILDLAKQELLLARDRIGIKPLYWSLYHQYLVFASELKAVLATGLIPQAPTPEAMAAYFYLGYLPQDLSPIEQVNKLLPGHYLRFGPHSPLAVLPYWSYAACYQASPPSDVAGGLQKRLDAAFQQTAGCSRVGYLASGHLGSAYLGSELAARSHQEDIGITLSFANENEAEVELADQIASLLNLEHRTVTLAPQTLIDNLAKLVWHLDEPIASIKPSALYSLYQQSHEWVDLLLTDVGTESILAAHHPLECKHTFSHKKTSLSLDEYVAAVD